MVNTLPSIKKSNEITAIPKVLDMLEIESCVITIDAMSKRKQAGWDESYLTHLLILLF